MQHDVELLKDMVDAINVTDHQSSVIEVSVRRWLHDDQGSRGRTHLADDMFATGNRMALQAGAPLGLFQRIANVLCLTGDAVPSRRPQGKQRSL